MSRPSAVLAAALAALLAAPQVWSCIHGAVTVSVMTGRFDGGVREEKLVARIRPGSNVAVKLFVGPPNARITSLQLTPEVLAQHEALAAQANGILTAERRARTATTRGVATRGLNVESAAEELRTNNGVRVTVQRLSGGSWAEIVAHLGFPNDDTLAPSMERWVRKVAAANRSIYAAKVDLTAAAAGAAAEDEALGVGVRIAYGATGNALRQQIVTDKWLEYLGSPRVAAMFSTPFAIADLERDFLALTASDGVLSGGLERPAVASFEAGASETRNLVLRGLPERDGELVSVTLRGGSIFFKNESLRLSDRMLQPARAAGAAVPGATEGAPRSIRGLPDRAPVVADPFGG
jgi:hypothetical protein